MEPVQFDMQDTILGAPDGWDEDQYGVCRGLPVMRGHGCFYSCWRLSFWERIRILFGVPVTLIIASSSMPPVAFQIGEPQ